MTMPSQCHHNAIRASSHIIIFSNNARLKLRLGPVKALHLLMIIHKRGRKCLQTASVGLLTRVMISMHIILYISTLGHLFVIQDVDVPGPCSGSRRAPSYGCVPSSPTPAGLDLLGWFPLAVYTGGLIRVVKKLYILVIKKYTSCKLAHTSRGGVHGRSLTSTSILTPQNAVTPM